MTPDKRRAGRPAIRKPMLNLRIDPVVYAYLDKCASRNGRTLAEETTFRLNKSMIEDQIVRYVTSEDAT